ncbi:TetR/AcrR family transcriptional regulator [Streptomyces sp. VRA16 Mangrove soil]|uniref:TetR/AcrR family transcriptional regulator n=1 Tax=Streptomyces sp. VRA16 Mangrove soil TaxID=2817434 RepID=UPI001A9EE63C|nr:TetR/AcrR family transcriptional regulator [Streptomyces sp. VRA16 Mangrove soil]MBO1337936.1 TetR/AcrR family transcriptional regulator [Streptomyces sp. VRA16 Mangrove soil]
MTHPDTPTRERLLDAAKRLFLEKGADQVSLRAINARAALNPGAVHYHFGSREGLVTALLERELKPLWTDRMRLVGDGSGTGPAVTELAAALVEPFAELVASRDGRVLCHLLARSALPTGQLPHASSLFVPAPFEVMVGRALPRLTPQEVTERCRLAFTLVMETYGRPLAKMPAEEAAFPRTRTVVAFVAAGLTAPSTVGRAHD